MNTKRRHEGYLLIDHRNSPGVGAGFGHGPSVGAGKTFEGATITCSHCHALVVLNPDRTRERAWCAKCDHYICDACAAVMAASGVCTPMAKKLDEAGNRAVLGLPVGELTRG